MRRIISVDKKRPEACGFASGLFVSSGFSEFPKPALPCISALPDRAGRRFRPSVKIVQRCRKRICWFIFVGRQLLPIFAIGRKPSIKF